MLLSRRLVSTTIAALLLMALALTMSATMAGHHPLPYRLLAEHAARAVDAVARLGRTAWSWTETTPTRVFGASTLGIGVIAALSAKPGRALAERHQYDVR